MLLSVAAFFLELSFLTLATSASPTRSETAKRASSSSAFMLAGDSTTATQSTGGGGWGDGFKNLTLLSPSFATNFGHDGRTTATFVSGPDWGNVLTAAKSALSEGFTTYVTIMFGDNDQKVLTEDQFKSNLEGMVSDVKSSGAIPILITPLSRRNYNSDGTINDSLFPWAGYTLDVASSTSTDSIDLLTPSIKYLEEIGETAAERLALNSDDTTHLNVDGSIVFGRMVSDLLVAAIPAIGGVTKADQTLTSQIEEGVPSF